MKFSSWSGNLCFICQWRARTYPVTHSNERDNKVQGRDYKEEPEHKVALGKDPDQPDLVRKGVKH